MRSLIFFSLVLGLLMNISGIASARHMHLQKQAELAAEVKTSQGNAEKLMKPWPVETMDMGGVLLFSDSPEYVRTYGILYSDVVRGEARVFYYHVNAAGRPGKLAVVLENTGQNPVQVTVRRAGMPAPDTNYFRVGKACQTSYFGDAQSEKKIRLRAGGRQLLNPQMGQRLLSPRQLSSGMYDFFTTEPVRVSVVFCPENSNPVNFVREARVLPRDKEALRGTFTGMNRLIRAKWPYDPQQDGLVYIPLGDNVYDRYKHGVDATDGSPVVNYGNYGILYRVEVPTWGRELTQVKLSPLGGVYAGAVRVAVNQQENRLVQTPAGLLYFGGETRGNLLPVMGKKVALTHAFELADIGVFTAYRHFAVEYSPPGASNMPVLLIMGPAEQKR